MTSTHERFMRRALELAYLADGRTSPNPIVGAVLVRGDQVVGEGFHRSAGSSHAEIEAIQNAGDAASSGTLYVTLEPCNHHGRTPPCTEAILEAGIARVVYAIDDPNPTAEGGASRLQEAGIQVTAGILESEARFANRSFIHHTTTGRPWVIAKYAATLDGKIATSTGESKWITGNEARSRAHELRSIVDAVVVGAGTVIADDPQLNARRAGGADWRAGGGRQPQRVVIDSNGRVSPEARVFKNVESASSFVVGTDRFDRNLAATLGDRGVDVLTIPSNGSQRVDLREALTALGQRSIQRLMVEGGGELLGTFLKENLIDEVWAFLSPSLIGGVGALSAFGGTGISALADRLELKHIEIERLGDDILIRGIRKNWA